MRMKILKKLKLTKKCIFYSNCKLKDNDSVTCNNNKIAANYYQYRRPCGCYRDNLITNSS